MVLSVSRAPSSCHLRQHPLVNPPGWRARPRITETACRRFPLVALTASGYDSFQYATTAAACLASTRRAQRLLTEYGEVRNQRRKKTQRGGVCPGREKRCPADDFSSPTSNIRAE